VSEHDRDARTARLLGWLAAAAIAVATLIIIVISAAGPSAAVPVMPKPGLSPPWWHALHLTTTFVTVPLWAAMALGAAGVIAGLVAVARGARPPVRPIIAAAFLAVTVVTVLPPAGSTDAISYAADGRMAVIGHSPYVMTPLQLRHGGDPVGRQIPFSEIPSTWLTTVSVYGPVATGTEWVAAELGGASLARITFWLKLEQALAFGAVIAILDRMLRADPAQRLRAHLLWSVNPLLLWEIVAGGCWVWPRCACAGPRARRGPAQATSRTGPARRSGGATRPWPGWPSAWPRASRPSTRCSAWPWPGPVGVRSGRSARWPPRWPASWWW
jgi:hypothetical protein